ncbi:MAG: C4-type zinc ribbon domain-containing protein [Candidatus Cloacimonetes bacterium]|jgi:predicted  nucleic acid-binding Zn-ribbon protein|nr:C4-type zinc ribbon domain-containing protein [Candidatus Cloacimonadota bacterium]MDD3143740.1 C4-type zinc ribbon domain-containing protein [Candidatus Cloacimonadota bacterium]MDY0367976.1 C4-type zinc ribbon domain-containing protein [Candidatus Syntrophosphaera sp.]HOY85721.1 C4-type zinc ribbon domain-containing protein [Candidatus Syntrophosphaera sp.]
MEEQLRTLAKMQKLDDQIGALRLLQQQLPQELNDIIERVDAATANLLGSETERAETEKKQRALEGEIKQNQATIKKYATQLSDIKTNKEYKALNSEIAYLKDKISELESQELELMEEENMAKQKVEQDKKDLAAAEMTKREREGDLREKIESLDAEIDKLRAERTQLAQTLPQNLVRQYANMIKNKGNCAVVYERNGACGGCGFVIRPQIRIELELRKKINFCESCGRILMEEFPDL